MLQVFLKLLLPLSVTLFMFGFAFGYGVRELISRRRHAAGRKGYYRRQREKHFRRHRDLFCPPPALAALEPPDDGLVDGDDARVLERQ